MCVATR